MERTVKGNGDQRRGPHAMSRIDEKSSTDARNAIADKVGTQCDKNLVAKLTCVGLVKISGEVLRPD